MDYGVKFDIRFMTIFNLVANGVKPKKEIVIARKGNPCNFLEAEKSIAIS